MHTSVPCTSKRVGLWIIGCLLALLLAMGLPGCTRPRPRTTPLPLALRALPSRTPTRRTPEPRATPTRPQPTATGTPLSASLPIIGDQGSPLATSLPTVPASSVPDDATCQTPGAEVQSVGATPTTSPTPEPCAHLVRREGDHLVLDGQPFVFVGINATSLLDESLPESELPVILDALHSWGVTMVRIWVQPDKDLERLERLLDLSQPRGIRYVVTLQDYYHYKDLRWFSTFYKTEDLPHIEAVVTRFRDRPEIAIWEVMNEPWCGAAGEVDNPDCYRILQAWAEDTTQLIRRLDPCRPISLGTMGARHLEIEREAYSALGAIDTVDILSMHRVPGDWYNAPVELEIARQLGKPIMLGEVTVLGYSKSCEQLGPFVVSERARLLDTDMHKALELGVAGYLLWDYAPGAVPDVNGRLRFYCSIYGYYADDPVGPIIRALNIPRVPVPAQR